MGEGELRVGPASRRATVVVLTVLALAVGLPAAFLTYAGRAVAALEVAGTGYALEPAGRLLATEDGPVVDYPKDAVPRLRLRLPVRNTGRLTLHVRYETDSAPPPALTDTGEWPTTTVRVRPGETAWLAFEHGTHGCGRAGIAPGNGLREVTRVRVWVRTAGLAEREVLLPLPVPYRVPQVRLPESCLRGGS